MKDLRTVLPDYNPNKGELYSDELMIEYMQCMDEGLDVENLKPLFEAVAALEPSPNREKLADVIFDYVLNAAVRDDYKYNEPSELEDIKALRKPYIFCGKCPTMRSLKTGFTVHGSEESAVVLWESL